MECELFCGVCREVYEAGEREPVVLPSCGHAFCRSCLAKLEEDGENMGSYLSCPNCRAKHKSPSVHALPPVFALLHLSESYKKSMVSTSGRLRVFLFTENRVVFDTFGGAHPPGSSFPFFQRACGGIKCTVHGSTLEFWCCECRTTLCGHCLLEGHVREGHEVQALQTYIEDQRRSVRTSGARLVWELSQRRRTLQTEVASLVAQLVRAAHQSEVIYDLSSRVTKILEETERTANIDGILVATTLMGSLEHEVKNIISKDQARTRLLRCKSCIEAPKSPPVAVTPRQESVSEADWREGSLEEITGQEDTRSDITQAVAGGGETEALDANTRQEEVEAEAVHNETGLPGVTGEESDGGVSEEPTFRESEWPVVCRLITEGGRQARLFWENGRVHAYAFTLEDSPSHLLLQVRLYISAFVSSLMLYLMSKYFIS